MYFQCFPVRATYSCPGPLRNRGNLLTMALELIFSPVRCESTQIECCKEVNCRSVVGCLYLFTMRWWLEKQNKCGNLLLQDFGKKIR